MFSVLLTAMLAVGAQRHEAISPVVRAEASNQAGFVVIDDRVDFNSGNRDILSCNCIYSSSSYAWRWLGLDIKDCCVPLCGRGCPAYYSLYGGTYDFRRAHDYSWHSKPYRPRNISSRCTKCNRGHGIRTRQGDKELVTTPKVLVLPAPQ